jgi:epoxide hydrolase-like predicted phosphatase
MSENHAVKAVIFDMGGVILRTMDMRPRVELARRYGVTPAELDRIVFHNAVAEAAEHGQASPQDVWREVGRLLNAPETALDEIARQFFAGDRMDMRLVQYIRGLRPGYTTALLSNTWMADLSGWLREKWQVPEDTFDRVISSAAYHLAKPDPRFYRLALELVEADPDETLFVDDTLVNLTGAEAVGIRAIHFRDTAETIAAIQENLEKN